MNKRTVLRLSRITLVIVVGLIAYYIGNHRGLNQGYNEGFEYGIQCQAEEALQLESLEYKTYKGGK